MTISLNACWTMLDGGKSYPCAVPCSLYDTLIRAGELPDPYAGENQWDATALSDRDVAFETRFTASPELMAEEKAFLLFEGIDTLAEVFLNDVPLGRCDNMHRRWEYEVRAHLRSGENLLRVALRSPTRFIAKAQAERPLWGVEGTLPGYPHLRKAHCMFGWDWGPQLPDLGIWRPVSLRGCSSGRLRDAYYTQRHEDGRVILTCRAETETWTEGALNARCIVVSPDGETFSAELQHGAAEIEIPDPRLWWVRGLGEQPLYDCRVELLQNGQVIDTLKNRLGLRTLTVSREKDAWGEEFCLINNGIKVFAMGANYIPEDQIAPRVTPERTARLLESCRDANYNLIRVWGGGWYPADSFYDWCDENGIVVWQDFMFACAAYRLTPSFEETVRAELRDNIIRLRNHASLGLWCGNNEIESAWVGWHLPEDPEAKADYLRLFEEIIPSLLQKYDPETFYWPSSPSSGGGFADPSSNLAGDMHYWAVWHSFQPIEAFRAFHYRFCSEYGFESIPELKTVRSFAKEEDLELNSHVMSAHQKCVQGNEKLLYYLGQMVNYPYDFDRLIYCSQLVQADCIRSNVEHMRRARGRCMGSVYWQVNDSNPVISWSSIDYFGRWKALHYAARKFYAPLLLSCDDTDPKHPILYVTNDTRREENLSVVCHLRDHTARVLREWTALVTVPPLSVSACLSLDLEAELSARKELRSRYLEYTLRPAGSCGNPEAPLSSALSGGVTAFVRPKDFDFLPARIECLVEEAADAFLLTLTADCYAKSVRLSLKHNDAVFSDNWFDLHGAEPVRITLPKRGPISALTPEALRQELEITCY